MLIEFEQRRQDLLAQISELETKSNTAADAETKKAIDDEAWLLVFRLWLYRGTGPLAFMKSPGQVKDYLGYHEREALRDIDAGRNVKSNKELLNEVRLALGILEKRGAQGPLF